MTIDPKTMHTNSGRYAKENGETRNFADVICECTNAIRLIPTEESLVFTDGRVFKAEIRFSLATGGKKYLVFETPEATEEVPMYVVWGTDIVKSDVNNTKYTLWEVADNSWVGSVVQPVVNQNRVFDAIVNHQTQLFNTTVATPTFVGAVEIDIDSVLGGKEGIPATSTSAGGTAAATRFLLLKPSKKHVIEIENPDLTDAANIVVKSAFLEGLFPGVFEKANA